MEISLTKDTDNN